MIRQSFQHFFVHPIQSITSTTVAYTRLIINQLRDGTLIVDFEPKAKMEILEDSLKVFRFSLFVVIANIALNELFLYTSSDFISESISEIFATLIYYILFVAIYHISLGLNKLFKAKGIESVLVKLWSFYALIFIILFQFSGHLNRPLEEKVKSDFGVNVMLFILLVMLGHFVVASYLLKRKKIFSFHIGYFMMLAYPVLAFLLFIWMTAFSAII